MTTSGTGRIVRLEDLDVSQMVCGWGVPIVNKTVLEKPLTIRGNVFARGVGTHADSEFIIDLKGTAERFEAVVGVDDEAEEIGCSTFEVWVDGRLAATSGNLSSSDAPYALQADLRGGSQLRLVVRDEKNETHWAHADWCDAVIHVRADASDVPVCPLTIRRPSPPPDVNRESTLETHINWPRVTGATPGRPFLFRIPATGSGLRFTMKGLPEGLEYDNGTGIIQGSIKREGEYTVHVEVTGQRGNDQANIRIVAGKGKLCRTPPMGWNSWNVWGLAVDDAKVRAAADAFVTSGLAAAGYQFINIDDGWEAGRAPDGTILCNEKFPDMRALSDYVHSRGLKFGIYSSPGPLTCGQFTGSYEHEFQDACTYAQWGVDYLKYDWCSYDKIAKDRSLPECTETVSAYA